MNYRIQIKDINALEYAEVKHMHGYLSRPGRNMRFELEKRYICPEPGPHPNMSLALIWHNSFFVAWVGTRPFKEKFKGNTIDVQTIECFTDPELRRHGLAQLGVQALITAGVLKRDNPISVYNPAVVKIAERCGCTTVLLCEP